MNENTWTTRDIQKLLSAALDGFAEEFYGVASFQRLPQAERIKVTRAVKAQAHKDATYEWDMRDRKTSKYL